MTDDDELVEQLKRVQSDVGFRSWTRHRMLAVVVLVAFDLLISVVSVTAIVLIRNRDDERAADQTAARRGSCVQYNVEQLRKRQFAHDQLFALGRLSGQLEVDPATLPPDVKQRLDAYDLFIADQFPYRDCSVAGIESFLKNPPQDPASGG